MAIDKPVDNIKDDIISNTGIPEGKIRVYNVGSSEKIAMMINNNKYANNYDYHKAVFLLENYNILDNGFVLLKEDNCKFINESNEI